MDFRYCLTVIILLLEIVAAQRVVIYGCTNLKENSTVTLNATLDTTNSASLCTANPLTKATFRFTNAGGVPTDICEQVVTSSCDITAKAGGCACLSKVGEMWTFTQPFTYLQANHQGGTIDLVTDCLPEGNFGNRQKCLNIQSIGASSSTTTPTTTTTTPTTTTTIPTPTTTGRVYTVGEVLGTSFGTFGGCCVCGCVIGVILKVWLVVYAETIITFKGDKSKTLSEELRQQIKDAIVDYFRITNPQGTRYTFYVFDTPLTQVTIVSKDTEEFKKVVIQVIIIINMYNPGAHPNHPTITFQGKKPEPPSKDQSKEIKAAIVDNFQKKYPQGTQNIFLVFDDTPVDGPSPTLVTIVGKDAKELKEVEVQVKGIINMYNPDAYPNPSEPHPKPSKKDPDPRKSSKKPPQSQPNQQPPPQSQPKQQPAPQCPPNQQPQVVDLVENLCKAFGTLMKVLQTVNSHFDNKTPNVKPFEIHIGKQKYQLKATEELLQPETQEQKILTITLIPVPQSDTLDNLTLTMPPIDRGQFINCTIEDMVHSWFASPASTPRTEHAEFQIQVSDHPKPPKKKIQTNKENEKDQPCGSSDTTRWKSRRQPIEDLEHRTSSYTLKNLRFTTDIMGVCLLSVH